MDSQGSSPASLFKSISSLALSLVYGPALTSIHDCWKKPSYQERLKAGEEGDDRGWDGWMASLTRWTWVWASSRSWWRTGKPGVLQSMGSQRIGHNWTTELTDMKKHLLPFVSKTIKNRKCLSLTFTKILVGMKRLSSWFVKLGNLSKLMLRDGSCWYPAIRG